MAKSKKTPPAQLRYGDRTTSELREEAEQLRVLAASIDGCVDVMQQEFPDMATIKLDGVTKFSRGIDLVKDYIAKIEIALINQKYK